MRIFARAWISTRCLLCLVSSLCLITTGFADEENSRDLGEYVVIGWNDLGMHCMNDDFEGLAVLPPFNNLWAQVVHRGNPPELVTEGVIIEYRFPDNTTSVTKTNFWDYEDQLFGVDLPPDVGLTGNGLSGTLEWNDTAFEVTGIPLTPYDDAAPTVEQPYQLAELTLKDEISSEVLDQTVIVAPVSTEMHCGQCHDGQGDDKVAQLTPEIVWTDILTEHDEVEGQSLLDQTPVLCAECHSSNALGTTGIPGVKSLSESMHGKHAEVQSDLDCYACHPGDKTQCLRGAMHLAGVTCTDCHGSLGQVAQSIDEGRRPWLDEPRCAECHEDHPENENTLYRLSTGHGGMYCAACHNSPHAELPTAQPRDGLQAMRLQGEATYLIDCMICHTVRPQAPGPHGLTAPLPDMLMVQ